jgi:hypothetical protein
MISTYIQKPQWLPFQSKFIGSYMMGDPGWFIDLVYTKRMVTPFDQQDRDSLVYEFSRPGVSAMVPEYFLQKKLRPGYGHRQDMYQQLSLPRSAVPSRQRPGAASIHLCRY